MGWYLRKRGKKSEEGGRKEGRKGGREEGSTHAYLLQAGHVCIIRQELFHGEERPIFGVKMGGMHIGIQVLL